MTRGLALLALVGCLSALTVGDHDLPDRVQIDGRELSLRGGGTLRWKGLLAIYDAGLWTGPAGERRLEFRYRRSISASDLAEATRSTIGRGLTSEQRARLTPALERLCALYRDVREHDALVFTALLGIGTLVEMHGKLIDTIPGDDFADALFAIWLGPDPVDRRFRTALLGNP